MSTKQKALDKMRQNPRGVRFDEIDKVLLWYGFTQRQPRGGSSHYVYVPPDAVAALPEVPPRLTVPYKRPFIKQFYVKQMLAIVDAIDAAGLGPQD